jgi:hypothetical protein
MNRMGKTPFEDVGYFFKNVLGKSASLQCLINWGVNDSDYLN